MKPEAITPTCPRCNAVLVRHPDKDYLVCPNWLPNNQGCEGTIYFPQEMRKKKYPNIVISYKVESRSRPGYFYQVKIYESGDIYCGCVAGDMGKFCFHKQEAIRGIKEILGKIENHPKVEPKPERKAPVEIAKAPVIEKESEDHITFDKETKELGRSKEKKVVPMAEPLEDEGWRKL